MRMRVLRRRVCARQGSASQACKCSHVYALRARYHDTTIHQQFPSGRTRSPTVSRRVVTFLK